MSSIFGSLERAVKKVQKSLRPAQIIVLAFLAIVLLGGALLTLPAASQSGRPTSFLTGLFTATSATCVTGLILVDSGTYWSGFGQTVIVLLIQLGGLGFMTVATIFYLALNKKIGLRERMVMAQGFGLNSMSGVVGLVKNVLRGTFLVEGVGALILMFRFLPRVGFPRALWYGVFHSVSAFCNAGFDILGDVDAGGSLCRYVGDPVINITIMALIVTGGLGFFAWGDIRKNRRFSKFSVYTKMAVTITAILIFGGALLIAVLEWNNPRTIGMLPAGQKILASFFQSVTTRTAGFASISQDGMTDSSKVVSDILMFIGGSSGSTAGGAKTVTIGVLLLSALGTARGRSRITAFKRTITREQIENASSLVLLLFVLAVGGGLYLSAANGCSFMNAVFETISALATVGLSTGITPTLGAASKIILICYMFFGRVGIMTISVGFMMSSRVEERIRYADTKLMIG